MDEEIKKKQPNKPFKQTKQLIKLALNDGWTQVDIGKSCRVTQPVISSWKKGSALAKEHQLAQLLEQYGHILRRKSFKVYWVVDKNTQENSCVKVEGKVVFSYILREMSSPGHYDSKPLGPAVKIIVHYQGAGNFRLIIQTRSRNDLHQALACLDEEAKWISNVKNQYILSDLISFIEQMVQDNNFEHLSDAKALPFLIRKALLNHGFPVEDVVEYPAAW